LLNPETFDVRFQFRVELCYAELHAFGRITPGSQVPEFRQGLSPDSEPVGVTAGPDGSPST
jgi:hypothetical protein